MTYRVRIVSSAVPLLLAVAAPSFVASECIRWKVFPPGPRRNEMIYKRKTPHLRRARGMVKTAGRRTTGAAKAVATRSSSFPVPSCALLPAVRDGIFSGQKPFAPAFPLVSSASATLFARIYTSRPRHSHLKALWPRRQRDGQKHNCFIKISTRGRA